MIAKAAGSSMLAWVFFAEPPGRSVWELTLKIVSVTIVPAPIDVGVWGQIGLVVEKIGEKYNQTWL